MWVIGLGGECWEVYIVLVDFEIFGSGFWYNDISDGEVSMCCDG